MSRGLPDFLVGDTLTASDGNVWEIMSKKMVGDNNLTLHLCRQGEEPVILDTALPVDLTVGPISTDEEPPSLHRFGTELEEEWPAKRADPAPMQSYDDTQANELARATLDRSADVGYRGEGGDDAI